MAQKIAQLSAQSEERGYKPFTVLENVQQPYLTYVHTFQEFQNPVIQDWVAGREE